MLVSINFSWNFSTGYFKEPLCWCFVSTTHSPHCFAFDSNPHLSPALIIQDGPIKRYSSKQLLIQFFHKSSVQKTTMSWLVPLYWATLYKRVSCAYITIRLHNLSKIKVRNTFCEVYLAQPFLPTRPRRSKLGTKSMALISCESTHRVR